MSSVKNGRLLFNEIPTSECRPSVTETSVLMRSVEGYPEPGKTTVYDESETIDLDLEPLKGGFLVKTLYLSVDPYLRGLMRDPDIESYFVRPCCVCACAASSLTLATYCHSPRSSRASRFRTLASASCCALKTRR